MFTTMLRTKRSLTWATLFLGLMGSLTFAFWLPPFAGPDEQVHWYRAVQLSRGHVLSYKQDGALGDRLPDWAEALRVAIPASDLGANERVTQTMWHNGWAVPFGTHKSFVSFAPTAMYPPTFYVPQALAIFVGKTVHAHPLSIFYGARVANACAAWLVLACALWWAQELGGFLMALLLLPVVLQQLSTLSPDATMIALSALLAALVRRAATAVAPRPALFVAAATSIALLAQARPPLVALIPLLWLPALSRHVPERFAWPLWRRQLLASLLVCGFAFPWFVGCLVYGSTLRDDLPSVHVRAQQLLQDPKHFVDMLWLTTTRHAYGYLWMLVGALGWLNAPIAPGAFKAAQWALGAGLLLSLARPYRLRLADSACVVLAVVGSYVAMQGVFYLTWTSVDAAVVEGFQGRYAMMFLPLLPLALPRVPWPPVVQLLLRATLCCGVLRTLTAIPWALLERYYLAG